jgi:nitrate reductase delta subunit
MTVLGICDRLGALLAYPRAGYQASLAECMSELPALHADASALLRPFFDRVREMPIEDLEELYTHTFDINPLCCLEVGWQLFGEEYARGAFLVDMRKMLRDCGVPESTELPDHMAHALAVLDRLAPESAAELAGNAVLPALKKMIDGLAGKENPFEHVLKAIASVLQERYLTRRQGA